MKDVNRHHLQNLRISKLYDQHYTEYFTIGCHFLRKPESAQEAVHDALTSCIAIYPRIQHLSDDELHRYIRRAVHNRCKTLLKQNTSVALEEFLDETTSDASIKIADIIEQRDLIKSAVSSLPLEYQKCIYYKDHLGFDNETVAKLLGVKTASINMIHKRAKDKLKAAIRTLKLQGY